MRQPRRRTTNMTKHDKLRLYRLLRDVAVRLGEIEFLERTENLSEEEKEIFTKAKISELKILAQLDKIILADISADE